MPKRFSKKGCFYVTLLLLQYDKNDYIFRYQIILYRSAFQNIVYINS